MTHLSQSFTIATANYCLSIDNDFCVISNMETGESVTTFDADLIRAFIPVIIRMHSGSDQIAVALLADMMKTRTRRLANPSANMAFTVTGAGHVPSAHIPTKPTLAITFAKPNPEHHLYKPTVSALYSRHE